jgi:hypothetical protein
LLDPPAAVRRLQDRQDMLQPLAGQPLILTHNSQQVGVEEGGGLLLMCVRRVYDVYSDAYYDTGTP